MNLKTTFYSKKETRFSPDTPADIQKASQILSHWIPDSSYQPVILCIGTDRSTGDSLGPLTGTLLKEKAPSSLAVYGTLEDPVHAVNLEEKLEIIKASHPKPFIIAIDACLGRSKSVGSILAIPGPLQPGAALNKALPEVGDIHLSGVVNVGGLMEFMVLQNTRLQIVMKMARQMSEILYQLDGQFSSSRPSSLLEKLDTLL